MKVTFELIVKDGPDELVRVEGRMRDADDITIDEAQNIVEMEQALEHLFGHRFHINMKEIQN